MKTHAPHPAVVHPNKLLKDGNTIVGRINTKIAFMTAAFYGSAFAIWAFTLYSMLGAVVSTGVQNHMLYWSNAVQLLFCAVMTFVGNQISKSGQAKADADHAALTHIANQIDALAGQKANDPVA